MPSKEADGALDMLRGMLALPQFAQLADEYDITIRPKGGDARKIRPKETRERSDWGCIQKIGADAYRIRYTRWERGRRVRKSKTMRGATLREVKAERDRLRARYDTAPDHVPVPTYGQCWQEWYLPQLDQRVEEGELSPRTRTLYANAWRHHVSDRYAGTQMDEISPDDFSEFMHSMTDSNARISRILVKNLVGCAKAHGVKGLDHIDYLKGKGEAWRKDPAKREDGSAVYTREEMDALLRSVRNSVLEVPCILMACGSCRVGEACGALLSDCREVVHGGRLYMVVDIDKQLGERGRTTCPPKTKDSVRPVVIAEPWSLRLKEVADAKRADGLVWLNDDGTGRPVARCMVSHWWRKRADGRGVRYLPMTKLRNSWATWLLWDVKIERWKVDKMMGHAGSDVLAAHYDKPLEMMYIETLHDALFKDELGTLKDK